MPAPKSLDPLVPLPCRVPASTMERLRAEADAAGVTMSDILRSHLNLDELKPLGKISPRRRESKTLEPGSAADPALLQALRLIGINVSQLAGGINVVRLTPGKYSVDASALLVEIQLIRQELEKIAVQVDKVAVPLPSKKGA